MKDWWWKVGDYVVSPLSSDGSGVICCEGVSKDGCLDISYGSVLDIRCAHSELRRLLWCSSE